MWQPKIMVDSGAYLAWKRGKIIDPIAYCNFLHANPHITTYVNVDFINPRDPEESASLSLANFNIMQARGLDPIPVYHVREHTDYLRRYIDLGCTWIGLAGSASTQESEPFYKLCFELIDKIGIPVKVHTFGDSVRARLKRYPFYSADGSVWILNSMRWTDMSRTAQANDTPQQFAERVYAKARTYHRMHLEVRDDKPDFLYYFGCGTGYSVAHRFQVAAMRVVNHQHAIVSYYGISPRGTEMLKLLIEHPQVLLERCNEETTLLEQAKQRRVRV